jgi:hypothetical protein
MRALILLVAVLLTASACASRAQPEANAADEQWCASFGIHPGDPQYADCRLAAARQREPRMLQLQPPLSSPIPCTLFGNSTACHPGTQPIL